MSFVLYLQTNSTWMICINQLFFVDSNIVPEINQTLHYLVWNLFYMLHLFIFLKFFFVWDWLLISLLYQHFDLFSRHTNSLYYSFFPSNIVIFIMKFFQELKEHYNQYHIYNILSDSICRSSTLNLVLSSLSSHINHSIWVEIALLPNLILGQYNDLV